MKIDPRGVKEASVAGPMDLARIPDLPDNWYLLAGSGALGAGKLISVAIAGREIVLYRGAQGPVAYAAHCAHMGCHLKHARGDGAGIRCAMHNRLIAADGGFIRPDGQRTTDLTQPTFPVVEAFGCLFVWLGDTPATDLPRPALADQGPVMTRYAGDHHAGTNWVSLVANGCDMEHLAAVHDRALRDDPVVDTPAPGQFRISYVTRVTGRGLADRLVKWLSGDHIRASIRVYNGSLMLVQSGVWRPSFFLLSMCPNGQGGTDVRAAVGAGGSGRGLDRLRLWLTARVFLSFLAKDFDVLEGLRWQPPTNGATLGDRVSQRLFQYFAGLR